MLKLPVLCLMGPTAAGKTALAMELVQQYPCRIISVDSAMVYRGMDIGTAKPSAAELALAPHSLIDLRDPKDAYSVAEFRQDALQEIAISLEQRKLPLLVGGTMLYFHMLQQGIAELPTANPIVRAQLNADLRAKGSTVLHQRLQQVDASSAARIHPNDPQRVQRALEVYLLTGKPLSEHLAAHQTLLPYRFINIALAPDRALLHTRIAQRFTAMLEQGLIDETRQLYQRADLHAELPAMRCVGYRQTWQYLAGKINYTQLQEQGIIATRQLAKRQLTWLRGWDEIQWFDSLQANTYTDILQIAAKEVKYFEL